MKSVSAIAGTAFGVLVAGVLALIFGQLAGISGYNVSEVESLLFIGQNIPINIGGLLFSGILISTLGAVMDVGMSLASTIDEIHEKKPELSVSELLQERHKCRQGYDGYNVKHADTCVCRRLDSHADDRLLL